MRPQGQPHITPENMIKSLVPPAHLVCIPVTGVHAILMWHTPGADGNAGICNYAAVDQGSGRELTAMMTQRCGFKVISLDSAQQDIMRFLFSGVLATRNPGGSPGDRLPADVRYWLEDMRERFSTVTDAHRSLYFLMTVYLGRSAPPLPACGVPGIAPETLAYIQSAKEQGDGIKLNPRDIEGSLQAWLDSTNKNDKAK